MQMYPSQLKATTGIDLFREGYDLWRDSESFRKMTQKQTLLNVAAELFEKWELRIAFDQYFSTAGSQRSP